MEAGIGWWCATVQCQSAIGYRVVAVADDFQAPGWHISIAQHATIDQGIASTGCRETVGMRCHLGYWVGHLWTVHAPLVPATCRTCVHRIRTSKNKLSLPAVPSHLGRSRSAVVRPEHLRSANPSNEMTKSICTSMAPGILSSPQSAAASPPSSCPSRLDASCLQITRTLSPSTIPNADDLAFGKHVTGMLYKSLFGSAYFMSWPHAA